jgi:hypothetical protein
MGKEKAQVGVPGALAGTPTADKHVIPEKKAGPLPVSGQVAASALPPAACHSPAARAGWISSRGPSTLTRSPCFRTGSRGKPDQQISQVETQVPAILR